MKTILCALALGLSALAAAQAAEGKHFPYPWSIDDFPNGLRLVTVPTDHPNLIALYIVVQTGSRNEVEPGRSGYAHFFEHMMFRGSENFTPEQRDAILKGAGASVNAYTTDDRTVYHILFSKEDLEKILEIEADRFQRLKYSQYVYRTETRAILGEYNKSSANPVSKLLEVLRDTAYERHPYKHTTMGFLKDIEDMPNQFDYSLEFYRRYYRPEYTTVLLVGDVERERAFSLTQRFFSEWTRGQHKAEIPAEPAQTEPRTAQVDWPSPTLPYLAVAFHGPAYSDRVKDKAALDLLLPIAFGENSDLYRRLVLNEQKVDMLAPFFPSTVDPGLFTVIARVKEAKDVEAVREAILTTFKRFAREPVAKLKLDETRSRIRFGTAVGLDSSNAIAGFLAPYIGIARSPETIERLGQSYEAITPAEIQEIAAKYFRDSNRTMVTLAAGTSTKEEK
jgi:zinc protease